MKKNKIVYGLCCICIELKKQGVSYRTMTHKTFISADKSTSMEKLSNICINNSYALLQILKYCKNNGIYHYRIPSGIFPLFTHPNLNLKLQKIKGFSTIKEILENAGEFCRKNKITVSSHPSQFVVLASKNESTRKISAQEINFNSHIFDLMRIDKSNNGNINIHINTNPVSFNFENNFSHGLSMLTTSARKRLVIENEDRGFWNVENLYSFLKKFNIPLTLDFLHHKCNNNGESYQYVFKLAYSTWKNQIPIFHYAESKSENKPREHSEFCKSLPPDFGKPYICEIEAKGKDIAIIKMLNNSK